MMLPDRNRSIFTKIMLWLEWKATPMETIRYTEDGFQPLRPLPPDAGVLEFEVGDVVDADYRDGWWTGVVRKVMGCDRYRVFFENPPDLIEFEKNQMHFHQDWVNGK